MLKNILNKLIRLAGHKLARYVLAVWCFLENIFFPFPSDAIVIPMSISKPKKWFETFMIASIAAFLGAIVAYGIGSFMFNKLGIHIFELSGVDDPKKILAIFYKKSTMIAFAFILFISGFTPLPFNLLAITSGFVGFNFLLFAATAFFTRASRYFLLSYLFSKYGSKIQGQINKNFSSFLMWVIGSFVIVIAGMYLFYVKFPQYFAA
ncbi:MAG: DedA family protein [Candidatus Fonsibacter sp.]|nr:DedA family protein [Candidatus Fonsibacter sp.]